MHEKEIEYFSNGLKFAKDEFVIDAISDFQTLIDEFPKSDLADDAMYNIALLYYNINQFQQSINSLDNLIAAYPDGVISTMDIANEVGSIVEKAKYLLVQNYLGLDDIKSAEKTFNNMLDNKETYILENDQKKYYFNLAKDAIELYKEIK
jgi:TolA-binding protein|tara:strand:+ start:3599 stop:4048 length:450 start_codon:yes stop_codon:yes gene_type:complete